MKYINTDSLTVQTYFVSTSRVNGMYLDWKGVRLRRHILIRESDRGFVFFIHRSRKLYFVPLAKNICIWPEGSRGISDGDTAST